MIRPTEIMPTGVDQDTPQAWLEEWDWGDADDLAPLLKHIRVSTAQVIFDQMKGDCKGWFDEDDGLFHVELLECSFSATFDVLSALAVGKIEFDNIDTLRAFTQKIDAVAQGLHAALNVAEGVQSSNNN